MGDGERPALVDIVSGGTPPARPPWLPAPIASLGQLAGNSLQPLTPRSLSFVSTRAVVCAPATNALPLGTTGFTASLACCREMLACVTTTERGGSGDGV